MSIRSADAVVIGAGHHGLVAAAMLADAGWDVVVFEGRDKPGGAISSRDLQGFVVDEFSSCYPLGKASPVMQSLGLEEQGLEWVDHRPALAHVAGPDDEGSLIAATPERTAALLDADHPGDGDAWLKLCSGWDRVKEPLLAALLRGWPPVRSGAKLARVLGAAGLLDFARFAVLPSHQLGREWFGGRKARDLLAGNAAHSDISPLSPISGFVTFILAMAAQDVGFPMPKGGAGNLAMALARRAEGAGASIVLNSTVAGVEVTGGRATGVHLADGTTVAARRAVIADVGAHALYHGLLPDGTVPSGLLRRLERFVWDPPTIKLNLLLDEPLPWRAPAARGATIVHAGGTADELVTWHADIATGKLPKKAFALVGQATSADPTRSPSGTESLWAYTHLPDSTPEVAAATLLQLEEMLDELAPGWRGLERERWLQNPLDFEAADPNLLGGAVGGGTSQLFQQGPWRPVAGLGGATTHLQGLFHASAAVHPGGAVHGGAGFNAARAALREASWWSRPLARSQVWAQLKLQSQQPHF